jgi:hypothetical protein
VYIQNHKIYKESNNIVTIGKAKKKNSTANSQTSNKKRKTTSITIKPDLMIIPIAIENPTSPSLYSFFNGLKNVRRKRGSENN